MSELSEILKNEYKKKEEKKPIDFSMLLEMVEQLYDAVEPEVIGEAKKGEEKRGRFSYKIDIPMLVPSEAWGNPDSQSRQQISKVFRAVTGGRDIRKRIESVNGYLDVSTAKRKRSVGRMINMMMVIEALQATLNDYNESAAGFVFEGFMAALTGGHQVAGRVKGTLPIEDFMAFSEYGGASVPVSLKLLGAGGPIKGSYTNIVDFLLLRGSEKIKYLVAYKLTRGEQVEKITIYDFDITVQNFIDFINNTSGGPQLLAPVDVGLLRSGFLDFAQRGEEALFLGDGTGLAELMIKTAGYQGAGLLHNWVKSSISGQEPAAGEPGGRELTDKEIQAKVDAAAEKREKKYQRIQSPKTGKDLGDILDPEVRKRVGLSEALERGDVTPEQAFHYIEKQTLLNEGASGDKSQWSASFPQLEKLATVINLQNYGEIDLSQNKIDELTEIYSDKINNSIGALLTAVKDMSEHVSEYYSADDRKKGAAAGEQAEKDTEVIKKELEGDPLGRTAPTEEI